MDRPTNHAELLAWVDEVARLDHGVSTDDDEGLHLLELVADLPTASARYIRLTGRNYGTIPDWHPGRGGEAFIFVDEIVIE